MDDVASGSPLRDELPVGTELLDASVVDDVDIAGVVDNDPPWPRKLTCPNASGAPLQEEMAIRGEALDAIVERVGYVDGAGDVHRDILWVEELAVPRFHSP